MRRFFARLRFCRQMGLPLRAAFDRRFIKIGRG